jgi:L-2-hydroxycarboxylate dehydrogenase (NAD+)
MRQERINVSAEDLEGFVAACLTAVGVPKEDARTVAEVLVAADLRGVESHGVARLHRYVDGVRKGEILPARAATVVGETPATAVLDAGNGLGQPAAVAAMRLAIDKARAVGVGFVTVRRTNHFGIAGYYAMMALEHGMAGFATTNARPQVAPTFGAEPMFGTNPIAVAFPVGTNEAFVLDMATSVVPRGRVERLVREGGSIPAGWAVDSSGEPLREAKSLVSGLLGGWGYSLLPLGGLGELFGGHKGYGLGLLVDLLCGPLAGAAWGRHVYGPDGANLGQCFAALRLDCFREPEALAADAATLLGEIRASHKMAGQSRIYTAGEKEAGEHARRSRNGIPLHPSLWRDLVEMGESLGVEPPAERSDAVSRAAVSGRD